MKKKSKKLTDAELAKKFDLEHPIVNCYTINIFSRKDIHGLCLNAHGTINKNNVISSLEALIKELSK